MDAIEFEGLISGSQTREQMMYDEFIRNWMRSTEMLKIAIVGAAIVAKRPEALQYVDPKSKAKIKTMFGGK